MMFENDFFMRDVSTGIGPVRDKYNNNLKKEDDYGRSF
jgi:hypothetical protein